MPITRSANDLVQEANARVRSVQADEALAMAKDDATVFIDLRDIREVDANGMIPGAVHVPRGMLEFWFAPDSPYFREAFADDDKTFVLYCASGGRSALGADSLRDMGLTNVAHLTGGIGAWAAAGGTVAPKPSKKPKSS